MANDLKTSNTECIKIFARKHTVCDKQESRATQLNLGRHFSGRLLYLKFILELTRFNFFSFFFSSPPPRKRPMDSFQIPIRRERFCFVHFDDHENNNNCFRN